VLVNVEPAPSAEEHEAILAALKPRSAEQEEGGWAAAAIVEGVEEGEADHP
jgi:hypothetical protein